MKTKLKDLPPGEYSVAVIDSVSDLENVIFNKVIRETTVVKRPVRGKHAQSFSEVDEVVRGHDPSSDIIAPLSNQFATLTFQLPLEMYVDLSQHLKSRGLHVNDFMRLAVRNSMRGINTYGLRDIVRFGKYHGEPMEVVIRTDPSYVSWALRKMEGFNLTEDAMDLFDRICPPKGKAQKPDEDDQPNFDYRNTNE